MRLLVLDDDADRRTAFLEWYQAPEFDMTLAPNGYLAMRYLREAEQPFDVAFLDHDLGDFTHEGYLPGRYALNGYDVCRYIVTEIPERLRPKLCVIHSWNPPGAARMSELLRDAGMKTLLRPFEGGREPILPLSADRSLAR